MSFFKEPSGIGDKSKKGGAKKKKERPLYIGDLERKVVTEKGGEYDEVEDAGLAAEASKGSYVHEMEEIRKSFKFGDDDQEDDDDEEDGSLLKPKVKTKEERKEEESDYRVAIQ